MNKSNTFVCSTTRIGNIWYIQTRPAQVYLVLYKLFQLMFSSPWQGSVFKSGSNMENMLCCSEVSRTIYSTPLLSSEEVFIPRYPPESYPELEGKNIKFAGI